MYFLILGGGLWSEGDGESAFFETHGKSCDSDPVPFTFISVLITLHINTHTYIFDSLGSLSAPESGICSVFPVLVFLFIFSTGSLHCHRSSMCLLN